MEFFPLSSCTFLQLPLLLLVRNKNVIIVNSLSFIPCVYLLCKFLNLFFFHCNFCIFCTYLGEEIYVWETMGIFFDKLLIYFSNNVKESMTVCPCNLFTNYKICKPLIFYLLLLPRQSFLLWRMNFSVCCSLLQRKPFSSTKITFNGGGRTRGHL